jgi:hypothetical protein
MAKRRSSKKKTKGVTYAAAKKALDNMGVFNFEFGKLNSDGTVKIGPDELESVKAKLNKGTWSKVRFVALNAPFKRRSPISPG